MQVPWIYLISYFSSCIFYFPMILQKEFGERNDKNTVNEKKNWMIWREAILYQEKCKGSTGHDFFSTRWEFKNIGKTIRKKWKINNNSPLFSKLFFSEYKIILKNMPNYFAFCNYALMLHEFCVLLWSCCDSLILGTY